MRDAKYVDHWYAVSIAEGSVPTKSLEGCTLGGQVDNNQSWASSRTITGRTADGQGVVIEKDDAFIVCILGNPSDIFAQKVPNWEQILKDTPVVQTPADAQVVDFDPTVPEP